MGTVVSMHNYILIQQHRFVNIVPTDEATTSPGTSVLKTVEVGTDSYTQIFNSHSHKVRHMKPITRLCKKFLVAKVVRFKMISKWRVSHFICEEL